MDRIGRVGAAAEVVHDHRRVGMCLPPASEPVSDEGRLATARSAPHEHRPRRLSRQFHVDRLEIPFAPEVKPFARAAVGIVPTALERERIRDVHLRVGRVDERPEILANPFGKCLWAGIVLHDGKPACADPVLESCEFFPLSIALGSVFRSLLLRPRRVAKVKERPPRHLGVVKNTMENLEFRDALATAMFIEPRLLDQKRAVELAGGRHPAVTFAEQPHEKRSGPIDFGQADRQHLALLGLRLGDPPAEIDVHEFHLPLAAAPPEFGKHLSHEKIPLAGEIPKRRTDEDPDGARVEDSLADGAMRSHESLN